MKAILIALALSVAPALAQQACPAAASLAAGAGADAPMLAAGQAVMLKLKPAPQVHYNATARRADDAKAFGGVAAITIPSAGTWRVSLGSAAWIAVAQNGVEVRSAGHNHAESCLVKMVDFPLQAGKALIEISGTSDSSLRLMAAPAP